MRQRDTHLPPSVRATLIPTSPETEAWRADLRESVRRLAHRRIRVAILVYATVHVVAYPLFDLYSGWNGFIYRASVIAFLFVTLALTRSKWSEHHAINLAFALSLFVCIHLVLNVARFGIASATYVDIAMGLVITGLLFPFSTSRMAVLSALTALAYGILAAVAFHAPGDSGWVLAGAFYIVAGGVIASIGARLSTALRVREAKALWASKHEHENAERLLHNVLPPVVVDRLKRDPSAIADGHPEATVLFADIVGFTPLSAKLDAEALVDLLNDVFSRFDAMTGRHGLEKIKTIGDAYMAASGVPEPRPDHAQSVASMAIEMRDTIESFRTPGGDRLRLRIGIHSGPLVAGVIGSKKFIYDLWGDTVNTASRMESHGEPGAIHVSEATHALLKDDFLFESRGTIDIKGKGEMRTYFLTGPRPKPDDG